MIRQDDRRYAISLKQGEGIPIKAGKKESEFRIHLNKPDISLGHCFGFAVKDSEMIFSPTRPSCWFSSRSQVRVQI